jgi:phosphoglucomutase
VANDPRAGQPADPATLVDVAALVRAYTEIVPDPSDPAQRVAFGTSGHRGSSFRGAFNEAHILAISEAICRYRELRGYDGPLFLGRDSHALSEPATRTALEVLLARGVDVRIASDELGVTPTPAVSHAIVVANRAKPVPASDAPARQGRGLADGIVVTPSHNPPDDGGFKYNPPNGGPADTDVTGWIQAEANRILEATGRDGVAGVARLKGDEAERRAGRHDPSPRLPDRLCRRSRADPRLRSHPRLRDPAGSGPARRGGGPLLAPDRRALPARSDRGERRGRSDLPVHDV